MSASATVANKGLSLASLRRVRYLWKDKVQGVTLAELKVVRDGTTQDQVDLARRTHHELKLRIAHRLKDFLFLPFKVMVNPSVRLLYDKYVSAYIMHEGFRDLGNSDSAAQYWEALAATFQEHQHVTRLLGNSRRQLVHLDPELAPILDAFLDRFFISRIGTHLLGANFLQRFPVPLGAKKPAGVAMGVLQPTNPVTTVRDLASMLATSSDGISAHVSIEDGMDASILYVPGHLRGILREILHNAMSATVRAATARGGDPPPVNVKVNRGQFGVFVTVSDQGGGIAHPDQVWNWGPDPEYGTPLADDEQAGWPEVGAEEKDRPSLLPLGFGLPLARLTARYFGGDVRLQSLLGYGTNAYVHIPELQQQGALGVDDSGGSFF